MRKKKKMNKKQKMQDDIDKLLVKIMTFEKDVFIPEKALQDKAKKNEENIIELKKEVECIRPMLTTIWGNPLFAGYRSKK